MHADEFCINALSDRIVGCALRALNMLGAGFLEWVYENALRMKCVRQGLRSHSRLHLCRLLNFGRPRLEIHRVAHEL
jgi:hypothetical protein